MFKSNLLKVSMAVALTVSSVAPALADDASAQAKFDQAKTLFAGRAQLANVEQAITVLAAAQVEAQDVLLKFDIMILASRSLYWKAGKQSTKDAKMAVYEAGFNMASEATKLKKEVTNTFAEGYYFYAINLGKWGLAKGIDTSILERANQGEKMLQTAMKLKQRNGEAGEAIDGYGPYRTLSKMHLELSKIPFVRWNKDDAIKNGEVAYAKANWLPLNAVYLAEALFKKGGDEREARAKQALNDVISNTDRLHADRAPENAEELADARKVLADNS